VHPLGDCGCGCGGAKKGGCSCGGTRTETVGGGCGTGAQAPRLVYAIGTLDVDFGTEARRDSFVQYMPADRNNPHDPAQLAAFLDANPTFEQGLTWVLKLDVTAIYAVRATGTYARETVDKLRQIYSSLATGEPTELVSVPGMSVGSTRLLDGTTVPVLYPDLRGIYAWDVATLAKAISADTDSTTTGDSAATLENFLNRVFFEFRNLGMLSQDRALNYAATNALWSAGCH
jgi:hypothetical protein